MSLKAFHLIFIIAATLLTAGFGVWAIREYTRGEGSTGVFVSGIVSLLVTLALAWYGPYFCRKLKHISYL
jgi:hypothetical protein